MSTYASGWSAAAAVGSSATAGVASASRPRVTAAAKVDRVRRLEGTAAPTSGRKVGRQANRVLRFDRGLDPLDLDRALHGRTSRGSDTRLHDRVLQRGE